VNAARLESNERASVDALVAAAIDQHSQQIRRILESAAAAAGPARCTDRILMPAIRRIAAPDSDAASISAVRLAVEAARAWIDSVAARAPVPDPQRPVVVACGPGDRHTLGLETLSMLLRHEGQPCRVLGAGATAGRVSMAVEVNRPAAVVLVAQRRTSHRSCVELLRALEGIGTRTFYAGAAFDDEVTRRHVPGTYLGTSFERARTVIAEALSFEISTGARRTE
jgi:methanogenic corrinoid protein MtbC1